MAFTPRFYVASSKQILDKAIQKNLFSYPGICYLKDTHNLAWMLDSNIPAIIHGENQYNSVSYDKETGKLTIKSDGNVMFEDVLVAAKITDPETGEEINVTEYIEDSVAPVREDLDSLQEVVESFKEVTEEQINTLFEEVFG